MILDLHTHGTMNNHRNIHLPFAACDMKMINNDDKIEPNIFISKKNITIIMQLIWTVEMLDLKHAATIIILFILACKSEH